MIPDIFLAIVLLLSLYRLLRRRLSKPSFANRTVWITGASSGIGEHLAYEFGRLGARLILSARTVSELERVKGLCPAPEHVTVLPLDLGNPEQAFTESKSFLASLEEKGQRVDIIVENAGKSMRSAFEDFPLENHLRLFDLNVHGVFAHLQALTAHFLRVGGGQIVGITSVAGKLSMPYRCSYAASKAAFIALLDSVRAELRGHNVAVTNVMPGYVKTNLSKNSLSDQAGQQFGADTNLLKGMTAAEFAREAVKAVYNRERETQISESWYYPLLFALRSCVPGICFWVFKLLKDKQLRTMQAALEAKIASGCTIAHKGSSQ